MGAIDSVLQDRNSFVVSKDFKLVGEEKRIELVEENFEATKETENGDKWDGIYEVNAYTTWN